MKDIWGLALFSCRLRILGALALRRQFSIGSLLKPSLSDAAQPLAHRNSSLGATHLMKPERQRSTRQNSTIIARRADVALIVTPNKTAQRERSKDGALRENAAVGRIAGATPASRHSHLSRCQPTGVCDGPICVCASRGGGGAFAIRGNLNGSGGCRLHDQPG